MEQPTHAAVAAALTGVLTQLGDALAAADLGGLLTSESELSTIAMQLSRLQRLTAQEQQVLRPELERARAALVRCERLGGRLQGMTSGTLATSVEAYTRRGATDGARPTSQVEVNV